MDAADEWREKGNAAFNAADYRQAVQCYTAAIEHDPTNRLLFSNRSRAYLMLRRYEQARLDARVCIHIDPKWSRGWWRLAAALSEDNLFEPARLALLEALRHCPDDPALADALNKNAARSQLHSREKAAEDAANVAAEQPAKSCVCGASRCADEQ